MLEKIGYYFNKLVEILEKNSLRELGVFFQSILAVLSKLGIFLVSVVLVISSLRGVFSKTYLIQPIGLPDILSQDGLDGSELSGRIIIRINSIRKKVLTLDVSDSRNSYFGEPVYDNDAAVPEDDIKLFGISINSVKTILRVAFGTEGRVISGSILKNNNELQAKIHLSTENELLELKEKVEFGDLMGTIDRLVDQIAEGILYYNDPLLLGAYYMQQGEIDKADRIAEKHTQIPRMKILKGYIEIAKDHPDKAYQYFKNAEEDGLKDDFNVQFGQGVALSRTGLEEDLKQSITHFGRASELNSTNPSPYLNRGLALVQMHKYDEASEMYKKAIDIKKDYSTAYYDMGKLAELKINKEEAIDYYKKAVKYNRNHLDAKNRLKDLEEK